MQRMMRNRQIVALLVAVALFLTACGPSASAAAMSLAKAEGTVGIADGDGESVPVSEDRSLYSGYQVGTEAKSHAWISLDDVKLVKMDEESAIELRKENQNLEIFVNSGQLFFNITEPLEEDETLDIRTSTMTVGIRGTCGWVSVLEEGHMQVCVLEGKVHCEVTDPVSGQSAEAEVSAGERADLYIRSEEGEDAACEIVKSKISRSDIPDFVLEEVDLEALGTELAEEPEEIGEETAEEPQETAEAPEEEAAGETVEEILALSEYESFGSARGGVMPVKKDGLWGAVNYRNEVIVPFEYSNFQAPDDSGNFVMGDTMEEGRFYTLFDPQGNILYEGDQQVRASGGMYIVLREGDLLGEGQREIAYHRTDGTLVQALSAHPWAFINGFYDGVSQVYRAEYDDVLVGQGEGVGYSYSTGSYQIGEVDAAGNIEWHEDPLYTRYLERAEEEYQSAVEEAAGGEDGFANIAGTDSYYTRLPLSTVNHGYYAAGTFEYDAGWITMCTDTYEILGECDFYHAEPDAEKGFVYSEDYFDEQNSFRSFYHDGAYFYNYGSNMVWTVGERDVLVDFALYPGMDTETADNRIVKAVYDQISMNDENYWLVKDGERWGYIDHDGQEAAMFEDAAAFYQGYALVREEGTAYLIDETFEKVQNLGEADSVSTIGELFVVTRGDTKYFYQLGQ
ncbi:FecR domain-containing protein [uncultured Acetatifactor sp.]|uniref:FecR domain-containing protein n=1 Tax=uncultured Acetatifactor sp. TaxID=1671927 RepID=UPI002602688D|nr:FecR domain-containing protein [uncultured Acetatifactor sp.]